MITKMDRNERELSPLLQKFVKGALEERTLPTDWPKIMSVCAIERKIRNADARVVDVTWYPEVLSQPGYVETSMRGNCRRKRRRKRGANGDRHTKPYTM